MKKYLLIIALTLTMIYLFCSCTINPFYSVGTDIDIDAPTLTLTSHTDFQYVSGTFELTGDCWDNDSVTQVSITIKKYDYSTLQYTTLFDNLKAALKEVKGKSHTKKWSLKVDTINSYKLDDGEYIFTVAASDRRNNTSNDSFKTVNLVIDNSNLVCKVTHPPLFQTIAIWDNSADLYDFNKQDRYQHGIFYIQGEITSANNLKEIHSVSVSLYDVSSDTDPGTNISTKTFTNFSDFTGAADVINSVRVRGSMWAWNVYFAGQSGKAGEVRGVDYEIPDGFYRVKITVTDQADNDTTTDAGLICVNHRSDYPYSIITKDDKLPVKAQFSGTTYDNDGLDSLDWTIRDDNGVVTDSGTITECHNKTSYTWAITAPDNAGAYKLTVIPTDVNGISRDSDASSIYYEKSYTLESGNIPTLNIASVSSDYEDVVDKDGNFHLEASANDKGQITKAYLAWSVSAESASYLMNRPWEPDNDPDNKYIKLYEYTDGQPKITTLDVSVDFNVNTGLLKVNGQPAADASFFEVAGQQVYNRKTFYMYVENNNIDAGKTFGKYAIDKVYIPKDTTYPSLEIRSPINGNTYSTIDDHVLTFSGKVTDYSLIRNNKVTVRIGSVVNELTLAADGSWTTTSESFPALANAGSYTLQLTAADVYGNTSVENVAFIIDNNTAYIGNVFSTNPAGSYKSGEKISIILSTNKPVKCYNLSDGLSITLNTGRQAVYKGLYADGDYINEVEYGKNLLFEYTVQDGDNVDQLDITDTATLADAVSAVGMSFKDDLNNMMSYTIPIGITVGSLPSNISLKVDTTAPTLKSISTTAGSGSYKAGTDIEVDLYFSEIVNVEDGTAPTITMSNGGTANYVTGSGSTKLVYSYKILSSYTNSALKWTSISGTGITDNAGNDFRTVAKLNGVNTQLSSVTIDTKAPTLSSITTGTSAGYYSSGTMITMTLTFSEAVKVIGTPTLTLSNGKTATYSSGSGTNILVFGYTVANGDDTGSTKLSVTKINASITDNASNTFANTLPASGSCFWSSKAIYIDTVVPSTPTVTGVTNGTTYISVPTIRINNLDTDGGKYLLTVKGQDNGWQTVTAATKTLANSDFYDSGSTFQTVSITVRQRDKAGNESAASDLITFYIDTNPIKLESITTGKPSGIYGSTGTEMDIVLTFNRPVYIKSKLTVNLTTGQSFALNTTTVSNMSQTLSGSITTASGKETTLLDVSSVTGSVADESGHTLSIWTLSGINISSKKNIAIDLTAPTLSDSEATHNGTNAVITLTYSEPVSVISGKKITVTRDVDAAPIILSEDEYNEYKASQPGIETYYELGVNGTNSSYVPDNSTKYILKFDYEPADSALVNLFKNITSFFTKEYVLESDDVSVSNNVVTLTIPSADFVTGDTYKFTTSSAGLVRDGAAHTSTGDLISNKSFTSTGAPQPPVIRVNKISGATASSTTVKINTITKGATLEGTVPSESNAYSGTISATTQYAMRALKGGTYSAYSYEKAFKTTLKTGIDGAGGYLFRGFRGADVASGSATIPNFPLSWDESNSPDDYTDNEATLLAAGILKSSGGTAYTWAVNTKIHFHGMSFKKGEDGQLVWKWQQNDPCSVDAGGTSSDANTYEANWHNKSGSNED